MPIRSPAAPIGLHQIVTDTLGRRPPGGGMGLTGGTEAADTPLPVYTLPLDALDSPDPLRQAQLIAWRYIIREEGRLATADARMHDAQPEFFQLNRGPFAAALVETAARAEALVGDAEVEARILEIPPLKTIALWLHGADDQMLRFGSDHADTALVPAATLLEDLRNRKMQPEPAPARPADAPTAAPASLSAGTVDQTPPEPAITDPAAEMYEQSRKRPQRPAIAAPATASTRPLTILAQDPSTRLGRDSALAFASVDVPAEALAAGPTGYRIKVVDYDASSECLYAAKQTYVDAKGNYTDPFMRAPREPLPAFERRLLSHPNFHAQNVYAIAMRTLARFERALGRRIAWGFDGHQLHVVPHAFCAANAFYSKADRALLFGYFQGASGEIVYTCLSHDVVAHETTHALLDGLRNRYSDISMPDQAAFHEGFADVVALLSMFSLEELVAAALGTSVSTAKAGQRIRLIGAERLTEAALRESILFGLAEEVGAEIGPARASALRRSVDLKPDVGLMTDPEYKEPHTRGEIFAAAILQTFLAIWVARIAQLGTFGEDRYNLDMVVEEGTKAADHLLTMCIRALDYCPPTDIDFQAYLAALLTADAEIVPDDSPHFYRRSVRQSFAAFGISSPPDRCHASDGTWLPFVPKSPLTYERTHFESMLRDKEEVFRFIWENRQSLEISERDYVEVLSVRQSQRVAPDGFILRETVCEYVVIANIFSSETESALGTARPSGMDTKTRIRAYGSGTLIFDQYGRVKYHIARPMKDGLRQAARLEFLYGGLVPPEPAGERDRFASLHRRRAERQREETLDRTVASAPAQELTIAPVAAPADKRSVPASGRGPSSLTIYSYQVGFGDCFLLRFGYDDGVNRHILIDFGTTGLPEEVETGHMTRVAEDIRDLTGGHLTAIVATHRHADHISGFGTTADGEGPGKIIEAMTVDLVLQPWTEAPDASIDGLTLGGGEKTAMRTQTLALGAMQNVASGIVEMLDQRSLRRVPSAMIAQLDFIGRDNVKNLSAVERLMRIGQREGSRALYLYHGADAGIASLLPGVTTHVLGPPTLAQTESIRKQRSRHPDEFWLNALQGVQQDATLGEALGRLFTGHDAVSAGRLPRETRWIARHIDEARGDQFLSLVHALDRQMNNTSLILLFEAGGKSFLFPGDAQWENWEYALTSAGAEAMREKLKDVDVYKVGHHGSTNATPKSLWNAFRKTGPADEPNRLTTLVSTMPGKHGESEDTAVPNPKLMNQAEARSNLHSTHLYAPGELRREVRFKLDSDIGLAHGAHPDVS